MKVDLNTLTGSREDMIAYLGMNRVLAHQVLFKHRHPDQTPDFHHEIIQLWHGADYHRVLAMAFREAGKSTIAEEAFIIEAAFAQFHNAIIIGSTEKRACERLRAIKHELETNELLQQLFGFQIGKVWNEAEIILANGVRIIAVGRGQSLRGTKHLHYRPDFAFADDIEDREHVSTPEARDETQAWFLDEFLPCLDKTARIRMNATPLDIDSLPMRIQKWQAWITRVYPIEHVSPTGERVPTWPARYPIEWIDKLKRQYDEAGDREGYMREYMCVAEDPSVKLFTRDIFKVKPVVRTWQPVWAMYDPARTTNKTSATTGWAVWSWVGNRMVVWDAGGENWKPDEIIAHVFKIAEEYAPVAIGIEEDGLNEFILQPLRHEQVRRGILVPISPQKAPRGKLAFIGALQPYFKSGEITFAQSLRVLTEQFLSFPTGKIDAPNALAYALKMRPGVVVYDGFAPVHAVEGLAVRARQPVYAAVNSGYGYTTAVAVQVIDGMLHVLRDAVREGDPGGTLSAILMEIQAALGQLSLVAPARHWGDYDRVGLRGACAAVPVELRRGGAENLGRDQLRALLSRQKAGYPCLRIDTAARWTLNAFSAGYCFPVEKNGRLADEAAPGVYRALIEGLEAFTALTQPGKVDWTSPPNYALTPGGQRYLSALPRQGASADEKANWLGAADGSTFVRPRNFG